MDVGFQGESTQQIGEGRLGLFQILGKQLLKLVNNKQKPLGAFMDGGGKVFVSGARQLDIATPVKVGDRIVAVDGRSDLSLTKEADPTHAPGSNDRGPQIHKGI